MKILVVKLSSLGDLFHALPAVHNLKLGLKAEVHWVTHDSYVSLVQCFTDVDRVIPFYRNAFFRKFNDFYRELKKDHYDYVIDFQGLFKSALVSILANGKRRIGPSFAREGANLLYHETAGRPDRSRHAVDQCMDVVRHIGLSTLDPIFPVNFPDVTIQGGKMKIAVVPASRWPTKNWPAECWIDTIRRIRSAHNVSIYLLGAPEDIAVCTTIENGIRNAMPDSKDWLFNMAGKSSLPQMGGILKQMNLLISNDSGPVHMAAATGTRTLVIFGPTAPQRTGPYGQGHKTVTAGLSCQPCFSRSCRQPGIPCLSGVTPDHVTELALKMM